MKARTYEDQAREILSKPYQRRLTPEAEGGYSATISEFPGCFAEGASADDALRNLEKVAESWLTVSLAHRQSVKEPISFDGVSGKIALRIPRGLHQQVYELAEAEDCSVNQLLTSAVAEYVGRKQTVKELRVALNSALYKLHTMYFAPSLGSPWASAGGILSPTAPAAVPLSYSSNFEQITLA